ncbi:Flagellar basal-body P-ring formation protein flgA [Candidatus Nitrotoga sp. HW29]|uniref:flagellar basal body P-ring formation chaperone FlgA n=1 Tax=Candidatus Nitrotoga sp. HW29 TaxID=2886963 RepID=UPI001EF28720|nr:flagellar basal body P-ring formation chaperone FlgA [Candidatus Nitrotoga sp. HW29]CAH1905908.1 Flagellar basal-body P-ring formation protein flgA [Candidatus Nitrotoga sp. HW29]
MKNILQWILLVALACTTSVWAVPQQSHAEIRALITTFVHEQTLNLPGQVTITVNEIDRRVSLPACPALEAFLPPGGQLLGNSTVGVRCTANNMKKWTLFVPVHIKVSANLLVANSFLQQGHVLRAEDIGNQKSELAQLGILTDPLQAIGKILKYSVGAGQVLKQDMLHVPYVVKQGQTVQIQIEKQGFKIHADGQALSNAAEGQTVQVKTSSGQVVSGVVQQDGAVSIRP